MTPDVLDEFNLRLQHHLLRMDLADFTRIRLRRDPDWRPRMIRRASGMTGPRGSDVAELSIIVTAYNIERYIEQCLDSVAAQTFSDFEVLVVDDGSSDTTPSKIAEFCDRRPALRPPAARRQQPRRRGDRGQRRPRSCDRQWVGFVDGDDYVEPTMFERLVAAAVAADADLAVCAYQEVVDGSGERRDPADAHRWAELTEPLLRAGCPDPPAVPSTHRGALAQAVPPQAAGGRRDPVPRHVMLLRGQPVPLVLRDHGALDRVVPEVLCYHRVDRAGQTMSVTDEPPAPGLSPTTTPFVAGLRDDSCSTSTRPPCRTG